MKVFALFQAYGNSSGRDLAHFELLCVCHHTDTCMDIIAERERKRNNIPSWGPDIIHKNMNANNNWTYIGKRNDCKQHLCNGGIFGGYVIEEMEVL